jgi:hypothetical protein
MGQEIDEEIEKVRTNAYNQKTGQFPVDTVHELGTDRGSIVVQWDCRSAVSALEVTR